MALADRAQSGELFQETQPVLDKLLNALPLGEKEGLTVMLRDTRISPHKLSTVLKEEGDSEDKPEDVPNYLYNISPSTIRRWREKNSVREIRGL